jgi:signal recognition particle receptor subunit beta
MVELNHRERSIKVKIAYYGPALGGKTTNLQVLHQRALGERRGEMVSVNSAQDRTILFDLLPLKAAGFRGFDLRLQLLAVPGQAMYATTRRLVLKGADSVVFVANSAADRWEENIQSFREMTQNLLSHQLDPASIPLVLQYNKRDLPEVTPVDFMDRAMNARRVAAVPAVAVRGEGVLETFSSILLRTMQDLASRYRIIDAPHGQTLSQWTQQAVLGMFGTTALAPPKPKEEPQHAEDFHESLAAAEAPARRSVRVALSEEARASNDPRAPEILAESYVQASAQLTSAMVEVREELQVARRRLDDFHQTLAAAQEVLAGQPLEPVLRGVLARMASAGGADSASFLLPEADRTLRLAALQGLGTDPLLRSAAGVRLVTTRFLADAEPKLHPAADALDVADALEAGDPVFAAVVSVPVRTPGGLQALGLLYYGHDAALPAPDVLAHLALTSRALSASLELARALETVRNAERSLHLALAGTASVRGFGAIATFLLELRDRLGAMRRQPDVPPWFLADFAHLAPSLAGALAAARSLLAFSRGEIHKEPVSVRDLLAELEGPSLSVAIRAGVDTVSGDQVLLRLALAALVDHARGVPSANPPTALALQAVVEAGRIDLHLDAPGPPAGGAAGRRGGDPDLELVRRIAELHGGRMDASAGADGAVRYTLRLPAG